MLTESLFQLSLALATFLCTLVTGFILLFAIVVMPGIGTLGDRDFLRAFQAMDRVIQQNQPLFILVWVGSTLALLLAFALGVGRLEGTIRLLLVAAAITYILGTQLPTLTVNVPLNNHIQTLDIDTLGEKNALAERQGFEPRWNRWNIIRTVFASLTSLLLLTLLWLR